MIRDIDYETILKVWAEDDMWGKVHTDRIPKEYQTFDYDGLHSDEAGYPIYYAFFDGDEICGVNSYSHVNYEQCRSRGLYVYPKYRGKGIATKLLRYAIHQNEGMYDFIWSLPRVGSESAYKNAGFDVEDKIYDFGVYRNYRCRYEFEV